GDAGAAADLARDLQLAAVQLDHRLGEGYAEAAALVAAGPGVVDLAEGREHLRHVLGRDADAGVADADVDVAPVVALEADMHLAAPGRELAGVREQVPQHLPELAMGGMDGQGLLLPVAGDADAGRLGPRPLLAHDRRDHLVEVDLALDQPQLAALRLRVFEDVADEVEQVGAALVDVLGVLAIALLAERPQQLALQHL